MLDRVDRQVDIELRPIEVAGLRALESQDRLHRRPLEPGKFVEGKKELATVEQEQKPCAEMLVTSASEVAGPCISNPLLAFIDGLLDPAEVLRAEPVVPRQLDLSRGSGRGVGVLHGGRERLGALLRRRRVHPHDLPAVAVEVEEAA